MNDPRRRYPAYPVVNQESAVVLDEAIHSLTMLRSPMWEGDAGAALHALGSLLAEALLLLPSLTTLAREQDLSWDEIVGLLGIEPSELLADFRTGRAPIDAD